MSLPRHVQSFDANEYYHVDHDSYYDHDYVTLCPKGIEKLAGYYRDKYKVEIVFFDLPTDFFNSASQTINDFAVKYASVPNAREIYFLGKNNNHSYLAALIKEKNQLALVISNSRGMPIVDINNKLKQIKSTLNSKLTVYIDGIGRQADLYSCYADSLVMARDLSRLYPDNLLQRIQARSEESREYYRLKWPEDFLKTAQRSCYVQFHITNGKEIVHVHKGKKESLLQFRARYTQRKVAYPETVGFKTTIRTCDLSSYLRIKGFKFADLIETLHYLEKLQTKFGTEWTEQHTKDFLKKAKAELRSQGFVSMQRHRSGLKRFAENYTLGLPLEPPQIPTILGVSAPIIYKACKYIGGASICIAVMMLNRANSLLVNSGIVTLGLFGAGLFCYAKLSEQADDCLQKRRP